MDRPTKATQFLAIKVTFTVEQLVDLYIKEVVRLHGVPLTIVSNHDKFVSNFRHGFQIAMGIELYLSIAFHLLSDGQSERTIETLEDMLRVCVLDYVGSWDHNLPLVEWSLHIITVITLVLEWLHMRRYMDDVAKH